MALKIRRCILIIVSPFVGMYARDQIQFHSLPWSNGIWSFLGEWIVYYLMIALFTALVFAVFYKADKWFSIRKENRDIIALYYEINVIVLVLSLVLLFFIKNKTGWDLGPGEGHWW